MIRNIRWYEIPAKKRSSDLRMRDIQVLTCSSEEKFFAALVPNVEAWAVTGLLVSQETFVTLEEVLLTASTSAPAGVL